MACTSYKITNSTGTFLRYQYKSCLDNSYYTSFVSANSSHYIMSDVYPITTATVTQEVGNFPAYVLPKRMLGLGTIGNTVFPIGTNIEAGSGASMYTDWERDVKLFGEIGANIYHADIPLSLAFRAVDGIESNNQFLLGDNTKLIDRFKLALEKAETYGMFIHLRVHCDLFVSASVQDPLGVPNAELRRDTDASLILGESGQGLGSFASKKYRDICANYMFRLIEDLSVVNTRIFAVSITNTSTHESGHAHTKDGAFLHFDHSAINKSFYSGIANYPKTSSLLAYEGDANYIKWKNYNRCQLHSYQVELRNRLKDRYPNIQFGVEAGQMYGPLSINTLGTGHKRFYSAPFDFVKSNEYTSIQNNEFGMKALRDNSLLPIFGEVLTNNQTVVSNVINGVNAEEMYDWLQSAFLNAQKSGIVFITGETMKFSGTTALSGSRWLIIKQKFQDLHANWIANQADVTIPYTAVTRTLTQAGIDNNYGQYTWDNYSSLAPNNTFDKLKILN